VGKNVKKTAGMVTEKESNSKPARVGAEALKEAIPYIHKPFHIVSKNGRFAEAYAPACPLENLGDPDFCRDHSIHYPYYAGSMAHGISSAEIVERMANAGMLGFFGAAGLPLQSIAAAIERLSQNLGDQPFGFNLIHSPYEPKLEAAAADLYIRKGIRLIEASAYLEINLPLVRYRVHGIHTDPSGEITTPNRIIAKVSRVEVASRFFSPPPEEFLQELLRSGEISEEQADLARKIPMAQDLTAEADSGGHTDNRPALALIPTMLALRDQMQSKYNYSQKLRVGAAGGIATPASAAAAFSMGAAYIVTGSVNQACVESGTSEAVREILAQTEQADVIMAPAADMFEMGVKVQVLKRGTMFPMRAAKLYELYGSYAKIEDIPASQRSMLEKNFFRAGLDEIWGQTRKYFEERDNTQIALAEENPKHKMALIFRWYLGQTAHWAISGDPARKIDRQIWCGPAMGAFNEWTKGTFLERAANRKVVTVALNLLYGAAVMMRLNTLRSQGVNLVSELSPRPIEESMLKDYLK
jgi:trans-AT polyketide synthase/acyltransferase/oxidoreductase domain-containing protein